MAQQQAALTEALDLLSDFFSYSTPLEDDRAALRELLPWLNLEYFDRRAVNRWLRLYAEGDEAWLFQP